MRKWIGFAALLAGLTVLTVPTVPSADAQDKKDVKKDAKKGEPKKGDAKDKEMTGGSVEIFKDKGGDYRYRVKDADGKVIAMSPKGYDDKADVVKLLDQIKGILNRVKPTEVKD